MNFRLNSFLLIVCTSLLVVQQGTEAKAFLELFYDNSKLQNNYHQHQYKSQHYHRSNEPQAVKPVGGKKRFKQICNVINGINNCYA